MERDPRKCKCGVCESCQRRKELGQHTGDEEAPAQQEADSAAALNVGAVGAAARRLSFSKSSWSTVSSDSPPADTPSSSVPVSPPGEDLSSSSSAQTSSDERRQDLSTATVSSGSMPEISPQHVAGPTGMSASQACSDVSDSTASIRSLEPTSSLTDVSEIGTQSDLSKATSASGSLSGPPVAVSGSSSSALTSSEERRHDPSTATLSSGSMPEISPQHVADPTGTPASQACTDVSDSAASIRRLEPTSSLAQVSEIGTQSDLSKATSASGSLSGPSVAEGTSAGGPTLAEADMDVDASEATVASGSLEVPSAMEEEGLSTDWNVTSKSHESQSGYPREGCSADMSSTRDDTLADVSSVALSTGEMQRPSSEEVTDASLTRSTKKTRRTATPRQ
ncbi:hypothetical protein V5799_004689 [Amblyomma americanum]|uniref:Uncharacterized protein n=1 Tax=Amblyomma americanum TaxID=6943 RepID=A0AAQ4D5D5_AMBAM